MNNVRRRRLYHDDVGGKKYEHLDLSGSDGLSEPLLSNDAYDNSRRFAQDRDNEDDWTERRNNEELVWTNIFSRVIAQWVQWFTNVVLGSGTWLGGFLYRTLTSNGTNNQNVVVLDLSPLQEERLQNLQRRLEVPFDGTRPDHQEALRALWRAVFPDRELSGLVSDQWKDMGWQGHDPSTDFRGGGFISLENLLFFANKYPKSFRRLLHKQKGNRSSWEYPFAVAGINVSFMLTQMLDLRSAKPRSLSGTNFLKILAEDELAFDTLFCVAFEMLDAQWLARGASYMEFNEVMKATQAQLERELSLEDISHVQDLPGYSLLLQ
uniref:TSA: Wollemia nobilis Ref_Wollemi_Transcript_16023_1409 transcribed RNA sequence n=1 Tax=Wollemia nobilis TaxID=56998 RepID=A0A0C9RIJ5_9CONI